MQSYEHTVQRVLADSPAFRALSRPAQQEMAQAMSKIAEYLTADSGNSAVARQMAPDLSQLRASNNQPPQSPAPVPSQQPAPGAAQPGAQPAPSSGGGGVVGRVG